MKKVILITFLSVILLQVKGQDPKGQTVVGFIAPSDSLDEYYTHDDYFGLTATKIVKSILERDKIPTARRREGMKVYVQSVDRWYKLYDCIGNNCWVEDRVDTLRYGTFSTGKITVQPELSDPSFLYDAYTKAGFQRFGVSKNGLLLAGRRMPAFLNVDALAWIGDRNELLATDGIAFGKDLIVDGDSSAAFGYNLHSTYYNSIVFGRGKDRQNRIKNRYPWSVNFGAFQTIPQIELTQDTIRLNSNVLWWNGAPLGSGSITETDPVFNASAAKNITSGNISTWNSLVTFPGFGTSNSTAARGDHNHTGVYQPAGSYLTAETDPVYSASPAKNITSGNISTWNSLISYPGLSDRLFKYDVANNYYRAFTSQLESGYTIGAFYGGSELPDPGSYTSLNVRATLGLVAIQATDYISARQRMYAGDGFHATDMDTSIHTSAAFRSYGIGTPMLIYFDPLMAVQTGTAYKFDTYRRILPGGYRAQFFNKQSDPVNIEHDGSINLPAGAQFKVNNVAVSGGSEANNLSPLWARGSTMLEGNRTLVSMNNANYDTIKNQSGASMAITLPSAGTWLINLTIQANAIDLDCNTWPSRLVTGIARSNNTRTIIRETSGTYLYVSSPPYVNYTGTVCDTNHSIIYTTTTSNDRIVGVVKFGSSYTGGEIYIDSAYINAVKVAP